MEVYIACLSCNEKISFLMKKAGSDIAAITINEVRCCDYLYKSNGTGEVKAVHEFTVYDTEYYRLPFVLRMLGLDLDKLLEDYGRKRQPTQNLKLTILSGGE